MRASQNQGLLLRLGVAVALAMAVVGGLTALARADHQGQRLGRLEAQAAEFAEDRSRATPRMAGSLCRQPLAAATVDIGARIKTAATASGLSLTQLSFEALASGLPTDLAGAQFDLRLHGDEHALTAFVKTLSGAGLPIFLDAADLATGPGGVKASFRGRLLCRRGA